MSNRFKLNGIIYQEVVKTPEEGDKIVVNNNHTQIVEFTADFKEIATVVIAVDEDDIQNDVTV